MAFKWSDQNTVDFLNNFKNYPCLWNYKLDIYKDKSARTKAIKSLIEDLNLEITEGDVKKKIKTIRTRYATELSKIRQSTRSGCPPGDIYVPTLYWFKHAEFLGSVCFPRHNTSNLDISLNPLNTEQSKIIKNESCGEDEQQLHETENKGSTTVEQNHSQVSRGEHKIVDNSSTLKVKIPKVSIKRKRKQEIPIDKAITDQTETQDENEFDLFCRSLAVQLKKMPLNRALICQEKLQTVMVQERLSHINSSNTSQITLKVPPK